MVKIIQNDEMISRLEKLKKGEIDLNLKKKI